MAVDGRNIGVKIVEQSQEKIIILWPGLETWNIDYSHCDLVDGVGGGLCGLLLFFLLCFSHSQLLKCHKDTRPRRFQKCRRQ